jgi:AcrR family transcriptional regulator
MTKAAPRRRSEVGGYPRGEETRARIVAAALEVFGADGFDRGSTRAIAARAGVPPPALQYYFDSKEGLHRACAEFIIESFKAAMAPSMAAAEAALGAGGAAAALDALCGLLEAAVDYSVTSATTVARSRFLGRGQADGAGPAFPLIRDRISRPLFAMGVRLVGQATGRDPQAEETRLVATVVLSPLTAFHTNRENTLANLGWTDFRGPRLPLIKQVLRQHTQAALAPALP